MDQSIHPQNKGTNRGNTYNAKTFMSIQNYTGEEYQLYDSNEKVLKIAEEHTKEINDAIRKLFREKYSSHVKVNNMVGTKDSVTIFVESVNEPYFHTFVVLPVHEKQKKVMLDSVWSQEGEIERAIKSGLYVMAFKEEFLVLNEYLENVTKMFPLIGTPEQVISKVKANGYTTPYYFISPSGSIFKKVFAKFMLNPKLTGQEIRSIFDENPPCSKGINICIEFYMKDKEALPEQNILDTIVTDIQNMTSIPKGAYSFYLNDNLIDIHRGVGKKGNTLTKKSPRKLLKE